MKESTAQKLGIILAYTNQAIDTIQKSRKSFEEFMSVESIDETISKSESLILSITKLIEAGSLLSVSEPIQKETADRLSTMRDSYLGNSFENKEKVFEWWSFFGGASLAQWNMVKGLAESVETDSFAGLAYDGLAIHESLFDNVCAEFTEAGRAAAK